jgi:VanZ family protein
MPAPAAGPGRCGAARGAQSRLARRNRRTGQPGLPSLPGSPVPPSHAQTLSDDHFRRAGAAHATVRVMTIPVIVHRPRSPARAPQPAPDGGCPVARWLLAAGLLLALYASLRPFTGWTWRAASPFAFLWSSNPAGWTNRWDVLLNAAGYLALGFCAVLALAPRLRGAAALVVASLLLALLSFGVEALQTYLPQRTSSIVDFLVNTGAAFAGGVLALVLAPPLAARGGLGELRHALFVPGRTGELGVALLALWLLALLAPRTLLFGNGDLRLLFGVPAGAAHGPAIYAGLEALIAAMNLVGVAWLLRLVTTRALPPALLLCALLALAVVARSCGFGLFWTANHAFDWVTPGALLGLAAGLPLALAALLAPRRVAAYGAAALFAAATTVVNLSPPNPYLWTKPRATRQAELAPLSMVTRTAAMLWPFAAIGFVLLPGTRREPADAAPPPAR